VDPIRILLLEPSAPDADRTCAALAGAGLVCAVERVETREEFTAALDRVRPALVLADDSAPGFSGLEALEVAQAFRPGAPFVFVSGAPGEEAAVEALKRGAADYVLKGGLHRLGPAVRQALDGARERAERRRSEAALRDSEEHFRRLADLTPQVVWIMDAAGGLEYVNQRWRDLTGADRAGREEVRGLLHPDDAGRYYARWEAARAAGAAYEVEFRLRRARDGAHRWFLGRFAPVKDGRGAVTRWFGALTDIDDLKQAQAALQEANRRKDEFLAMLGHELRNPLASARNAVEILRLLGPADGDGRWAQDVLDRQVGHLTRLVDDLLDVARITRGRVQLQRGRVDLAAVLGRAVEMSRPLLDARRHELTVAVPPAPLPLYGDATRLAQAAANLLNNAAKYTPPGGRVWLTAAREGDEWVVRVRDTGVGIPADVLPQVFDLFTQAERPLDRSEGGLGVGLTLVRSLVELHGGRVEAHSDGPGKGSEFVVRLPAGRGDPAAAGAGP
jgi:PAS domain S-box-containing protein